MDERGVYRATRVMTIGTGLSRITGLLRTAAMVYALGVTGTRLADTYNLANVTPNIIYELFLGGIFTAVFVPVLVELRAGRRDPSALVSVSLVALAVLAVVAAIVAPLIMHIYTFRVPDPEVRAAQHELATFLLRWFAPQVFFYGLSAIAGALLNVRGRFGPPMFTPVLNNLLVTGTFGVYARAFAEQGLDISTGAKVLIGAGTTAGVVVQAVVLLPYLRGERLRFRPRFSDPAVARVLRLSAYVIGYVLVNQAGLWVVLALANGVRGGVTSYQVAFMFFQLPHGLFAVSLHTALLPSLARAANGGDWDAYRRSFHTGVRGVAYLLLPSAVGYLILAGPIARLLLARGAAGTADAEAVAGVLTVFAIGLVSFSTFQLLTRCFYALPDTRTPTALNAVAVAVHTAVNFPLFAWLGVRGLALGHAIAYTIGAFLLLWALSRRIPGGLRLAPLAGPLARIAAITALMAIAVGGIAARIAGPDVLTVGVSAGTGAILYLAFSQVARVEERAILVGFLRGRGDVVISKGDQ
jgi:putative peptidoglycan lipid II flippase